MDVNFGRAALAGIIGTVCAFFVAFLQRENPCRQASLPPSLIPEPAELLGTLMMEFTGDRIYG